MKPLSVVLILTLLALWSPNGAQPVAAQAGFDLQAALAAARPGDTIRVPPGLYRGPVQIDQPVILEGQGQPVIDGQGQGDVITINAADVTVRGFVIRNSGDSLDREHAGITGLGARATIEQNRLEDVLFGIYLKNAPGSVVRENVIIGKDLEVGRRGDGIRLWYCAGSRVEANGVQQSRDLIIWFSPQSVVRGNTVETSRYGLHFMSTDDQLVENNILRHNSVGLYVMTGKGYTLRNNLLYDNRGPSGYGLGLKDVDDFVAEGNRLVANRVGLYVDIAPRASAITVLFERNLFAYNEIGITLLPLVTHAVYTGNSFYENGEQVAISGEGMLQGNRWSQAGVGNYWSDYAGYDANRDQVGDLPYRAQSLYEDLLANYPELRLFQLSPATSALELAARAFPIFQPRPKIADDHPLMAPPPLPPAPLLSPSHGLADTLAAAGLLLVAGLILLLGIRGLGTV
jgi:nitrous oxidase accessory protein